MDEEHQRFGAGFRNSGWVLQSLLELRNLRDDAVVAGTVAAHVQMSLGDRDVDVVPRRGRGALAADVIGPRGDRDQRPIRPEYSCHLSTRCFGELGFRNSRDQAMAFGTPRKQRKRPDKESEKGRSTHSAWLAAEVGVSSSAGSSLSRYIWL